LHSQKCLKLRLDVNEAEKVVQLDNLSEQKDTQVMNNYLFGSENVAYYSTLKFDEKNGQTKILTISTHRQQSARTRIQNKIKGKRMIDTIEEKDKEYTTEEQDETGGSVENVTTTGMKFMLNLLGIGISIIDQEPEELLYICVNKILVNYQYRAVTEEGETDTKTVIELNLGNFQIDNLTNDDYPVLLAPRRYYRRHLV